MNISKKDPRTRHKLRLHKGFLKLFDNALSHPKRVLMVQGNDSPISYIEMCREDDFGN